MRREYFGIVGELLPDRSLARVLVIAAEAPTLLGVFLHGRMAPSAFGDALKRLGAERNRAGPYPLTPLRVDVRRVRSILTHERLGADTLDALQINLPLFWGLLSDAQLPCYELTLLRSGKHLDRQWLAQVLAAEERIDSAIFDSRRPRAAAWTWPLKIGVLDTEMGRQLHAALLDASYRELFTPIIADRESRSFQLLLIPESLSSVGRLHAMGEITADAVVALGDAELGAAETIRGLNALMTRCTSGLAGVCFVPREQHVSWVQTVIRELAHNQSLPAAMFKARLQRARESGAVSRAAEDLWAPLVLGDADFVQSTYISDAAARFASALQHNENVDLDVTVFSGLLPELGYGRPAKTAVEVGEIFERSIPSFDWLNESGSATTFVRLQQQVEAQLGPIDLDVDAGWATAEPIPKAFAVASAADVDIAGPALPGYDDMLLREVVLPSPALEDFDAVAEDRHVQAELFPLLAAADDAITPVANLAAGQKYRLRVHIGPPRGGFVIVADTALDEARLPPAESGHELMIVYCPLSRIVDADGREVMPAPLQATIHLPRRGASSHADFLLQCGAEALKFRARLIVTHANRVLQTLLITATGEAAHVAIRQENRFTPGYESHDQGPPADIAFVVNDNPDGASGITTLVKDSASFIEPAGLKTSIETIQQLLSDSNVRAVGASQPKLDGKRIVKLLVQLANHGASIVAELQQNHPLARFERAERIQVVEAVDKAYLPVEFFYSGKAPDPGVAKLCPHAADALRNRKGKVHAKCPHREDDEHVCPVAFWGFQKCIERHPSVGETGHVFAVPTPKANRLGPIDCALLAASKRAKKEMLGPKGIPSMLSSRVPKVGQASSWKQWKQLVASMSPNLLLLLPHSGDSPYVVNMPALEISTSWLESSRVDSAYVRPSASKNAGPLVLLLGCSTVLTKIDFLNFVRQFYRCGAPMVLGTLATIHATQASLLACKLLDEITTQAGTGARFDEALLKVKRELLAAGHDVALGLIAYGHSSWRI